MAGAAAIALENRWWQKLRELDYRCFYCGRKTFPLEREHRLPVARGGSDDDRNIVPACRPCNRQKGTMSDREFVLHLEILRGLRLHPGPRPWCARCGAPRISPCSLPYCRC